MPPNLPGYAEGMEAAAKIAFYALYPRNPEEDWTQYACDKARHARHVRDAILEAIDNPPTPDDAFTDGPDMGVPDGVMPGDLMP